MPPDAQSLLAEAEAASGHDWPRAAALAARAAEADPGLVAAHRLHLAALRALARYAEAEAPLARAARLFPDAPWPLTEAAVTALAAGDRAAAACHAAALRQCFPEAPGGYQMGATLAREAGALAEAESTLATARPRFADQPWHLAESAWLAHARSRPDDALALAESLRARFPDHAAGYQIGARTAREQRRFTEASAILEAAAARFPTARWRLAEALWTAAAAGDHQATRTAAAALRAAHPELEAGYRLGFDAAHALALPEFAQLLAEAMARFPDHPWPLAEAAAIATERGDPASAAPFAAELRARFPAHPDGWRRGIPAARATGDGDAAATLLAEALARFPDAAWPLAEAVSAARATGDTGRAATLAAELRTRFPQDRFGWHAGATLLRAQGDLAAAAALLREAAPHFPAADWPEREASALDRLAANHAAAQPRATALARALPATPDRPRVVVVLGMHRAGTSLCTRLIESLGLPLGAPLMPAGPDNPDGYQEHLDIFAAHRTLLEALGEDWDTLRLATPLPQNALHGAAAATARAAMARAVTTQLAANRNAWAFKDPRTARFLPLWREVFESLGITPTWVLAVRDPRAVAASLFIRDRIPPELGALLWAEHYLDALRHLGPQIAAIVHYERWFPNPEAQLTRLARALGLPPSGAGALRPDLRHNVPDADTPLPALAGHLHAMLSAENPDFRALQAEAAALWHACQSKEEPLF